MKRHAKVLALVALAFFATHATIASGSYALRLHVHNLVPGKGQLLIAVCTEEQFLKADCAFRTIVAASVDPQVIVVPRGRLTPGRYAVQIAYDRNSNARLDRNVLGIPKERVGFSRDASGRMGPPKFDQAAFEFNGSAQDLTINLY